MRNLLELYQILFNFRCSFFRKYTLGICHNVYLLASNGIITAEEKEILCADLNKHLPNGMGAFNWKAGSSWVRNRFLKGRIKVLKNL